MDPKDIIDSALAAVSHETLSETVQALVKRVVTETIKHLHDAGILDDHTCRSCHMNDLTCPNCNFEEFSQCAGCGTTTVCQRCAEDEE